METIDIMTDDERADAALIAEEKAKRIAQRQREQRQLARSSLATARENVRRLEISLAACEKLITQLEKAQVYVSKISDIAVPGEDFSQIQNACATVLQQQLKQLSESRLSMLRRRLDAARLEVKKLDAQLESLSR